MYSNLQLLHLNTLKSCPIKLQSSIEIVILRRSFLHWKLPSNHIRMIMFMSTHEHHHNVVIFFEPLLWWKRYWLCQSRWVCSFVPTVPCPKIHLIKSKCGSTTFFAFMHCLCKIPSVFFVNWKWNMKLWPKYFAFTFLRHFQIFPGRFNRQYFEVLR